MKKVKDKKKSKSKYKSKSSQLKDISKTQKRTKKVSNKKKVQSASKIKLKKMIKEAVNEAINELNTKDKEDNKKSKKIKVTVKSNNSNKYFVLEVELTPSKKMKKVINAIFEAARHVYNVVLGESLKRMRLMKDSKEYQNARNLPKGLEKVRTFQELNKKFQFTEYDMHSYVKIVLNSWLGEYVKSQLGQVLATRAFRAVYRMCIGKAKKVRFKNKTSIGSIEQKSNTTGFMWKDKQKSVVYQGEQIDINYDLKDSYIVYQLTRTGDVKYCRIIRRNIRGKVRYFVQLIAKGRPLDFDEKQALRDKDYLKTEEKNTSHDIVGLDIGPSTIAIVSEKEARLVQFCDELEDKSAEIRVLNRSIDRKRIAANPDNYDEKGRIKKGKKSWKKSKNQKNEERKRAEVQRKQAAHRNNLHGRLSNEIIKISPFINTEKLSYVSFQKNFGRSVGSRAPGMFIQKLQRKAENANGAMTEFSTYKTRLSQTCICGKIKKKPLSQRMHVCDICKIKTQRDLLSAFLARFVQEDTLNVSKAQEAWIKGSETILWAAFEKAKNASRGHQPSSFG